MSTVLWLALPYIALSSFVIGHLWRYKHDQFGWTTRSSQIYESRLLRLGSPLFHFGILAVFGGHVMGVLIPKSWTEFVGISEGMYHFISVSAGTLAGLATVAGIAILLYRRVKISAVRQATTTNDKVMYALLAAAIGTGMLNTIGDNLIGGGYDYRSTVSPWFRSLFSISPEPQLMVGIPISFQLHAIVVLALFAFWPYTRLVHVFSAPVGYLVRPYVVYRSREQRKSGDRRYAKAWETPEAPPVSRWRS